MYTNIRNNCGYLLSTSLWGRELKYYREGSYHFRHAVDLLVRSWIEIFLPVSAPVLLLVDLLVRSWIEIPVWNGNGVSYPVDLLVRSWIEISSFRGIWVLRGVDLLVRSWIEMMIMMIVRKSSHVDLLVRSWIEIYSKLQYEGSEVCRPPCEVVNWNIISSLSLSFKRCRPPCEVVNWNCPVTPVFLPQNPSTSLWGRELK